MTTTLPLFPLRVVLFPNSALPLHIFEERYKVLIGECLAEGKEFGINFVNDQEILSTGCTATVTTVRRRYEDGRMDIVVRGHRRYLLERVEPSDAPYMVGAVTWLPDARAAVDAELAASTIAMYNHLVARVYHSAIPQLDESRAEEGISYVMAQKSGMDLLQRQALLESGSENERLIMVRRHIERVLPTLDTKEAVERIVQSDGYL